MSAQAKKLTIGIVLLCVALIASMYRILELSVSVDDMGNQLHVLTESRDGLAKVLAEVQLSGADSVIMRAEPKRPGTILYGINEFTIDSTGSRRILLYRE